MFDTTRQQSRSLAVVIALIAALIGEAAFAHDSWMSVAPHARRGWTISLSTGEHYPAQAWSVSLARVERAELLGAPVAIPLLPMDETPHALQMRAWPRTEAVTVAVASLRASEVALSPDDVRVYVDGELGGDADLLRRHDAQGRWRERYRKHLKMLVRSAAGEAAAAATLPAGLPYELVPRVDPTTVPPGAAFAVCAYANGRRLPRAYIGLVDADGTASWQWSDRRGCVRVRPRAASGYLLRSIHIRAVDDADVDWLSEFASLTVHRLDAAAVTAPASSISAPAASGVPHVP